MEAAHSWHIPWHEWPLVPQVRREQMVAFVIHSRMREAFITEHAMNKGKDPKGESTYEKMHRNFH